MEEFRLTTLPERRPSIVIRPRPAAHTSAWSATPAAVATTTWATDSGTCRVWSVAWTGAHSRASTFANPSSSSRPQRLRSLKSNGRASSAITNRGMIIWRCERAWTWWISIGRRRWLWCGIWTECLGGAGRAHLSSRVWLYRSEFFYQILCDVTYGGIPDIMPALNFELVW